MGLASNGQKINGLAIAGQKFYPEKPKDPRIGKQMRYLDGYKDESNGFYPGASLTLWVAPSTTRYPISTSKTYTIVDVLKFPKVTNEWFLFRDSDEVTYIAIDSACRVVG
ncbi:hypothetical protein [Lactobacillus gigeriorum]|uniref:Uncharacterized protein n=1 Tax=Lactobacillus gigeriorum DSM 23908 = CRBIP 24.85 TaxID=1423751 RepID=I7KNX0_9LACO|nr:hypothetical protein [Lactobacillus gigeriorum]KRN12020.1 hypothetical protein FC38_GL000424 [Lactobacillus gigeriorum DSM 23908 = CRBIP 24.85]CCI86964.1 Protein of unknown function [Lactobacillus gigeriorum DSM 23908 = CRBIP 24.85]